MNLINVKSENKHQHHFKGFHLNEILTDFNTAPALL